MRKTTKLNRLRYREYFQDFDTLRKGCVKKNKFRSVVFQTMKYLSFYIEFLLTKDILLFLKITMDKKVIILWSIMLDFVMTSTSYSIYLYFLCYFRIMKKNQH